MGGIAFVQMVLNLDHFLSSIQTRFNLPPFTSFWPFPLFSLLAHYGFWSFEYPTSLTTTGAPSFIYFLIFALLYF